MTRPVTPLHSSSRPSWDHLEEYVREHIQQFIQILLEEGVTELLGRPKSGRWMPAVPSGMVGTALTQELRG